MADPEITTPTEWCTPAHLQFGRDQDTIVALACDDGSGNPDPDILQAVCDQANSQVDEFIAINPGLPISAITYSLRRYAYFLAIMDLFLRRSVQTPQALKDEIDRIEKRLYDISKNNLSVGSEEETPKPGDVFSANLDANQSRFGLADNRIDQYPYPGFGRPLKIPRGDS